MKKLNYQETKDVHWTSFRHKTWLSLLTLILFSITTSAAALVNSPCDPAQDFCISLIVDKSVPVQSTIKYNFGYDVAEVHTQLPDFNDYVDPNSTYTLVNLPVDLLNRVQIKNVQLKILEINQFPLATCSIKTPLGKKVSAANLKIRLLYNSRTTLYSCKISP